MLGQRLQSFQQPAEIAAAGFDEAGQLGDLCQADGGLQIRRLQVVSQVRVDVFVVVAGRQIAQLPTEALAAGVVLAGVAPAVAAPVANGAGGFLEPRMIDDNAAPFAHGHVVGGIETERGHIAEGAGEFAVEGRAEGVAVIFQQPEIVAAGNIGDDIHGAGIAERVRNQDGSRARADGVFNQVRIEVVCSHFAIHKNRNQAVLHDGSQRGGKRDGRRNDFIARPQARFAGVAQQLIQFRRAERRHHKKIGGGSGVHQHEIAGAEEVLHGAFRTSRRRGPG